MSEIDVRPFEHEHLEGALALVTAAGWETYVEDPARTERALRAPGSTTLVAVDDGAVAGLVQVQSDGEIQAHLSTLVVGERWRGRGVARRLLGAAQERAGGMRMDILTSAETFYRHLRRSRSLAFVSEQPTWKEGADGAGDCGEHRGLPLELELALRGRRDVGIGRRGDVGR
jgi:GNAT superfamily N-acetyltransferase